MIATGRQPSRTTAAVDGWGGEDSEPDNSHQHESAGTPSRGLAPADLHSSSSFNSVDEAGYGYGRASNAALGASRAVGTPGAGFGSPLPLHVRLAARKAAATAEGTANGAIAAERSTQAAPASPSGGRTTSPMLSSARSRSPPLTSANLTPSDGMQATATSPSLQSFVLMFPVPHGAAIELSVASSVQPGCGLPSLLIDDLAKSIVDDAAAASGLPSQRIHLSDLKVIATDGGGSGLVTCALTIGSPQDHVDDATQSDEHEAAAAIWAAFTAIERHPECVPSTSSVIVRAQLRHAAASFPLEQLSPVVGSVLSASLFSSKSSAKAPGTAQVSSSSSTSAGAVIDADQLRFQRGLILRIGCCGRRTQKQIAVEAGGVVVSNAAAKGAAAPTCGCSVRSQNISLFWSLLRWASISVLLAWAIAVPSLPVIAANAQGIHVNPLLALLAAVCLAIVPPVFAGLAVIITFLTSSSTKAQASTTVRSLPIPLQLLRSTPMLAAAALMIVSQVWTAYHHRRNDVHYGVLFGFDAAVLASVYAALWLCRSAKELMRAYRSSSASQKAARKAASLAAEIDSDMTAFRGLFAASAIAVPCGASSSGAGVSITHAALMRTKGPTTRLVRRSPSLCGSSSSTTVPVSSKSESADIVLLDCLRASIDGAARVSLIQRERLSLEGHPVTTAVGKIMVARSLAALDRAESMLLAELASAFLFLVRGSNALGLPQWWHSSLMQQALPGLPASSASTSICIAADCFRQPQGDMLSTCLHNAVTALELCFRSGSDRTPPTVCALVRAAEVNRSLQPWSTAIESATDAMSCLALRAGPVAGSDATLARISTSSARTDDVIAAVSAADIALGACESIASVLAETRIAQQLPQPVYSNLCQLLSSGLLCVARTVLLLHSFGNNKSAAALAGRMQSIAGSVGVASTFVAQSAMEASSYAFAALQRDRAARISASISGCIAALSSPSSAHASSTSAGAVVDRMLTATIASALAVVGLDMQRPTRNDALAQLLALRLAEMNQLYLHVSKSLADSRPSIEKTVGGAGQLVAWEVHYGASSTHTQPPPAWYAVLHDAQAQIVRSAAAVVAGSSTSGDSASAAVGTAASIASAIVRSAIERSPSILAAAGLQPSSLAALPAVTAATSSVPLPAELAVRFGMIYPFSSDLLADVDAVSEAQVASPAKHSVEEAAAVARVAGVPHLQTSTRTGATTPPLTSLATRVHAAVAGAIDGIGYSQVAFARYYLRLVSRFTKGHTSPSLLATSLPFLAWCILTAAVWPRAEQVLRSSVRDAGQLFAPGPAVFATAQLLVAEFMLPKLAFNAVEDDVMVLTPAMRRSSIVTALLGSFICSVLSVAWLQELPSPQRAVAIIVVALVGTAWLWLGLCARTLSSRTSSLLTTWTASTAGTTADAVIAAVRDIDSKRERLSREQAALPSLRPVTQSVLGNLDQISGSQTAQQMADQLSWAITRLQTIAGELRIASPAAATAAPMSPSFNTGIGSRRNSDASGQALGLHDLQTPGDQHLHQHQQQGSNVGVVGHNGGDHLRVSVNSIDTGTPAHDNAADQASIDVAQACIASASAIQEVLRELQNPTLSTHLTADDAATSATLLSIPAASIVLSTKLPELLLQCTHGPWGLRTTRALFLESANREASIAAQLPSAGSSIIDGGGAHGRSVSLARSVSQYTHSLISSHSHGSHGSTSQEAHQRGARRIASTLRAIIDAVEAVGAARDALCGSPIGQLLLGVSELLSTNDSPGSVLTSLQQRQQVMRMVASLASSMCELNAQVATKGVDSLATTQADAKLASACDAVQSIGRSVSTLPLTSADGPLGKLRLDSAAELARCITTTRGDIDGLSSSYRAAVALASGQLRASMSQLPTSSLSILHCACVPPLVVARGIDLVAQRRLLYAAASMSPALRAGRSALGVEPQTAEREPWTLHQPCFSRDPSWRGQLPVGSQEALWSILIRDGHTAGLMIASLNEIDQEAAMVESVRRDERESKTRATLASSMPGMQTQQSSSSSNEAGVLNGSRSTAFDSSSRRMRPIFSTSPALPAAAGSPSSAAIDLRRSPSTPFAGDNRSSSRSRLSALLARSAVAVELGFESQYRHESSRSRNETRTPQRIRSVSRGRSAPRSASHSEHAPFASVSSSIPRHHALVSERRNTNTPSRSVSRSILRSSSTRAPVSPADFELSGYDSAAAIRMSRQRSLERMTGDHTPGRPSTTPVVSRRSLSRSRRRSIHGDDVGYRGIDGSSVGIVKDEAGVYRPDRSRSRSVRFARGTIPASPDLQQQHMHSGYHQGTGEGVASPDVQRAQHTAALYSRAYGTSTFDTNDDDNAYYRHASEHSRHASSFAADFRQQINNAAVSAAAAEDGWGGEEPEQSQSQAQPGLAATGEADLHPSDLSPQPAQQQEASTTSAIPDAIAALLQQLPVQQQTQQHANMPSHSDGRAVQDGQAPWLRPLPQSAISALTQQTPAGRDGLLFDWADIVPERPPPRMVNAGRLPRHLPAQHDGQLDRRSRSRSVQRLLGGHACSSRSRSKPHRPAAGRSPAAPLVPLVSIPTSLLQLQHPSSLSMGVGDGSEHSGNHNGFVGPLNRAAVQAAIDQEIPGIATSFATTSAATPSSSSVATAALVPGLQSSITIGSASLLAAINNEATASASAAGGVGNGSSSSSSLSRLADQMASFGAWAQAMRRGEEEEAAAAEAARLKREQDERDAIAAAALAERRKKEQEEQQAVAAKAAAERATLEQQQQLEADKHRAAQQQQQSSAVLAPPASAVPAVASVSIERYRDDAAVLVRDFESSQEAVLSSFGCQLDKCATSCDPFGLSYAIARHNPIKADTVSQYQGAAELRKLLDRCKDTFAATTGTKEAVFDRMGKLAALLRDAAAEDARHPNHPAIAAIAAAGSSNSGGNATSLGPFSVLVIDSILSRSASAMEDNSCKDFSFTSRIPAAVAVLLLHCMGNDPSRGQFLRRYRGFIYQAVPYLVPVDGDLSQSAVGAASGRALSLEAVQRITTLHGFVIHARTTVVMDPRAGGAREVQLSSPNPLLSTDDPWTLLARLNNRVRPGTTNALTILAMLTPLLLTAGHYLLVRYRGQAERLLRTLYTRYLPSLLQAGPPPSHSFETFSDQYRSVLSLLGGEEGFSVDRGHKASSSASNADNTPRAGGMFGGQQSGSSAGSTVLCLRTVSPPTALTEALQEEQEEVEGY